MQRRIPRAQCAPRVIFPNVKLFVDNIKVEDKDGRLASRGWIKRTIIQTILSQRFKRLHIKIKPALLKQQLIRLSLPDE